jgi:Baseplate J-like protein
MALSISQILSPITGAQMRSTAVAALQSLGLQPQNWAPGGIASSLLTALCNIVGYVPGTTFGLSLSLANAIAQQWNPTATGAGLRLLSQYFYGFTAPTGTFASGQLVLTNTGGGIYTYGAGQAVFASTVANAQGIYPTYTNVSGFTLGAGATLTIQIQCAFLGAGGNSPPGFVTQLVTSMAGVTANNPNAITGTDPPTDDALRQMNLNSLSVGSVYGPRSAYAYAIATATNIVTGAPVNINRATFPKPGHINFVIIYVTSPSGIVDPNDLAGIAQCIESGTGSTDSRFHGARPDGVQILPGTATIGGTTIGAPAAAVAVPYGPAITVYCTAPKGTSTTTIQTTILQALTTWFASSANPIGGITASDDTNTNVTGIFESGVSGIIATAVASLAGCTMLASKFANATSAPDVTLLVNQVATMAITAPNLVVNIVQASN